MSRRSELLLAAPNLHSASHLVGLRVHRSEGPRAELRRGSHAASTGARARAGSELHHLRVRTRARARRTRTSLRRCSRATAGRRTAADRNPKPGSRYHIEI
jgi:hypothetical protein